MSLPSPHFIGPIAVAAAILAAGTSSAADASLCPAGDKVWYEADAKDAGLRIAVCSRPASGDEVGKISAYSGKKTASGFERTVLAEAGGKDRARTFTLRRYTRPQTTYLKFEFTSKDGRRVAIYDDFADGETGTRVKLSMASDTSDPMAASHVPPSEPLAIMALEPVVSAQPYDE